MKKMFKKFFLKIQVAVSLTLSAALLTPGIQVSAAGTKTVELTAVGDDLIHSPIYKACKTKQGYNFDSLFKHIKKDIQASDFRHQSGNHPCR